MIEHRFRKVSLADWTLLNLKIGALSFGSSGRLLMYQDAVVHEKNWMPENDFQGVLTITQVLPGPNLINLSVYLGLMLSGRWAAFLGLVGLALPGALLVVALVTCLDLSQRDIRIVFEGFSIASVVLFSVFIWRLYEGLRRVAPPPASSVGTLRCKVVLRFALGAAVAVASFFQWPLVWTLVLAGGAGFLVETFAP